MSENLTTKFKVLKSKLQSPFMTKCHIFKIKSALWASLLGFALILGNKRAMTLTQFSSER